MGLEFIWIILLIAVIVFIAEKSKFYLLNFGAVFLLVYLAFEQESVFLMLVMFLIAGLVIIYSVLGKN